MNWIISHVDTIFSVASGVVAVASTITAATPTPKDDNVVSIIRKVLDMLALNFGHAKNKN